MISLVDSKCGTKKGEILKYFLEHPSSKVHLRQLARILDVSTTWVGKSIRDLKEFLIVTKSKERQELLIEARKSPAFKALKQATNLYKLHESGLVDYLKETYAKPEAIVLFGSYAKGEDTEQSDIDIAIITNRTQKHNLKTYEKKLNQKIVIKELSKKLIEKEFWHTLSNGIVLYGYMEVPI